MRISDAMQTRLQDHPFIEFINKIQMDIANVSISCTSLFHNTSPGFPNRVTMRDIVSNYIYPKSSLAAIINIKILNKKGASEEI